MFYHMAIRMAFILNGYSVNKTRTSSQITKGYPRHTVLIISFKTIQIRITLHCAHAQVIY